MAFQPADKTAVANAATAVSTAMGTLEQAVATGLFKPGVNDADRKAMYQLLYQIQQLRDLGAAALAVI